MTSFELYNTAQQMKQYFPRLQFSICEAAEIVRRETNCDYDDSFIIANISLEDSEEWE